MIAGTMSGLATVHREAVHTPYIPGRHTGRHTGRDTHHPAIPGIPPLSQPNSETGGRASMGLPVTKKVDKCVERGRPRCPPTVKRVKAALGSRLAAGLLLQAQQ